MITAGFAEQHSAHPPRHRSVRISRNYRPSEQWLKAWAAQFPQLQGKRLICLPGRISRLKAHHHLITSLQRLKAEGTTDVAGLIVGGKDAAHEAYFRELQAQVIKAGVAEDIVFAGHRSDMREIYAISSVVLAVSNKAESFGRTALEPLCIGTPVVGFDIGGVGNIGRHVPRGPRAKPRQRGAMLDHCRSTRRCVRDCCREHRISTQQYVHPNPANL